MFEEKIIAMMQWLLMTPAVRELILKEQLFLTHTLDINGIISGIRM